MRVLVLLRGSAGVGKSTWIENNGLKPYTLCADDIRLMHQTPVLLNDGRVGISQSNDKKVWSTLFSLLESRMERGEFTVIDATNSKTSEMVQYKNMCDTYRYRIYCVDFTDVPIEEVKKRNANRELLKRVPEAVIDKMYSRFYTQGVPSGIKVIKPNEIDTIWYKPIDLSEYNKIHCIGDVHGCHTVLQRYLSDNGGMKDDELYLFTGDYIDRGKENSEVVNFLISIMNKKNVMLLEGNHEIWLKMYGHNCPAKSKEFELITKPQLEAANIDKKEIRNLYRRFGQCAYFNYKGNKYFVCHGGISCLPKNLTLISTEQLIKGVGRYGDAEEVANSFINNTDGNTYQIHGHRNVKALPVRVNDRVFNLEGQVEFGKNLRCIQITEDGIKTFEIKNDVYKEAEENKIEHQITNSSLSNILVDLRNSKYINEKKFGNISSFNFTRDAFMKDAWNEQTIKARGLYIDTVKGTIAARSYNKFFKINETSETKLDMLQHRFKFPVTAYVKENGYLGIVSYNEYEDDLFITTKSDPTGEYAAWFKNILYTEIKQDSLQNLKEYIKEHNVSFIFECVDMINDPHIIEYPKNSIFLLDIVHNDVVYNKYAYEDLCNIARSLGFNPKKKAYVIENWQDFYDWYFEVTSDEYKYNGNYIEGFVIEDSNGFMVKTKTQYYNFWKFMRGIAHSTMKFGHIKRTSALTTPLANEFYNFTKILYNREDKDSIPKDACTLRKMFYDYKRQNNI